MGESANLAFYAIVYSKGLVPKPKLQGALNKATLDGVPLETVLLETGAIKASDCVDALALRAKLGRSCVSCKGTTYLLPDKTETDEPCEFCGGTLLPAEKSAERKVRRPAPSERHQRPASSSGERPRSRASQRVAARRERGESGAGTTMLRELEDRLKALEETGSVSETRILEIVETRLAQEDLESFLEHVSQEATQRALKAVEDHLPKHIGDGRGVDLDVGGITDSVSEIAAKHALAIVQQRVEGADLSGLFDKVTEVATERTLKNVGGAGGGGGGGAATVDEDAIARAASERALSAVQERLAGLGADDETRNALQALEDYLGQFDLAAVSDRLASLEGASGSGADSQELEALSARLESMQASLADLQSQLQPLMDVEARLERLEAARGDQVHPSEITAIRATLEEVDPAGMQERLSREIQERLDRDLAGLPDRIGQEASAPVLQAIEARIQKLDLQGLPSRVTAEATQAVLRKVESQASQAAEQAVAQLRNGSMLQELTDQVLQQVRPLIDEGGSGGGTDSETLQAEIKKAQGRILEAVELRLSQNPPPEEVAQVAAGQAIAAVEERLAQLGDLGGGPSGPSPDEVAQVAAGQALAAVEERLAQLDGSGGAGGEQLAALQDQLMAVTARLEEVAAGASGSAPVAAPVDPEEIEAVARRIAEEVMQSSGGGGDDGGGTDLGATQILSRSALGIGSNSYDHKKFIALAREVKNIKDKTKQLEAAGVGGGGGGGGGGGDYADKTDFRQLAVQVKNIEDRISSLQVGKGGGGGGGGGDVVSIINSTEFKQAFDTKINQVLGYIKSDVVPKVVKQTLESQ